MVYRRQSSGSIPDASYADAQPSCNDGETLIGGGGYFVSNTDEGIQYTGQLLANGPANANGEATSSPTSWLVAGYNSSGSTKRFYGYAVCARP